MTVPLTTDLGLTNRVKIALGGSDRYGRGENVARGVVKEIAYMGDTSIFIVLLDSGKQLRVTQPNTHRHADEPLTWEDRVWVSWHESSAVVVTE